MKQCSDTSVTVGLTLPIACNSIAADGSDFYITPFVGIAGATGINCVAGNGYTSQVNIRFNGPVPAGNYVLRARAGAEPNIFY